MPVSSLTLEKPGVIMTCLHIWWEHLTASPPNRASSGRRSPGRPPILSLSCSPFFSRHAVVIPNSHNCECRNLSKCENYFNSGCVHSECFAENIYSSLCICMQLHLWFINCLFHNSSYNPLGTLYN